MEELLGWLPIPKPPAALEEATEHTEALTVEWWSNGSPDGLDVLINAWMALLTDPAFDTAPLDYRLMCHERASLTYCWRAMVTSSVPDLEAARDHLAVVIKQKPPWVEDLLYHQAIYHYSLAAISAESEESGRSVTILREVLERLPESDVRLRPRCLDVLARNLLSLADYDLGRLEETLNEVIDLLMLALAGPTEAPYRGLIATNLAHALGRRFKLCGRLADLDAAIAVLEDNEPIQAYYEIHISRATSLGTYYGHRYDRLLDFEDLRRSLHWHERAVNITPKSSPNYPIVLTNQGNTLLAASKESGDTDLLEQAREVQEKAVEVTSPSDDWYPSRLNNLGNTLSALYESTRYRPHLDRAIALYQKAIEVTQPQDSDLPSRHYNVASTLALRGRHRDRRRITRHYREACRLGMERVPEWALGAARQWGDWASSREEWREAVEAYTVGVNAVERLFGTQRSRTHKEAWLRTARGLPARAGYAFVLAGRPVDAVLVQERGRAMLLAEALSGHERVAHMPGDTGVNIDDIFTAAGSRPMVYLDAAEFAGVALVVDPLRRRVRAVELPGLRERLVQQWADLLREGYRGRTSDYAGWLGAVDAVSRWAYDEVMGPTLNALPQADAVTLVPVGRLTMLPLHAAWEPIGDGQHGRRYALDRAAVSYIPTARALGWAREGITGALRNALVVDEPAPVSAPPLQLSHVECAAVHLTGARMRILSGAAATRSAVLSEFGQYDLVHLSCHGRGRPDSPLDSGLLMAHDELLTLEDLQQARPRAATSRPRLVVLSACETDQPGAELPDEVVSLPSGLIQAGCRGVVATQWAVSSLAATLLIARFYKVWRQNMEPGIALAAAQRWLRDLTNAELAECARPDGESSAMGLPASMSRPLWVAARRKPPEERRFAHAVNWGAFAHVGA